MKLPLKYLVLLVMVALACTFFYQTYWLYNLYSTQKVETEQKLMDALAESDTKELFLRQKTLDADSTSHYVVALQAEADSSDFSSDDFSDKVMFRRKWRTTVRGKVDKAIVEKKNPLGRIKINGSSRNCRYRVSDLYERAVHAGVDSIKGPDFDVYNRYLSAHLAHLGLNRDYRIELLRSTESADSVVEAKGTPGYRPSSHAVCYRYDFNPVGGLSYRLTMEPLNLVVLYQMAGILVASLFILIILFFVFAYLIYIVKKQKTLDEMKSDFTNNMTHELKTPVSVAYAANDALMNFGDGLRSEKDMKYLNIIGEQLKKLSGLIEQILSMSMERRRSMQLNMEMVELKPAADAVASQQRLKADKPIELSVAVEPVGLCVKADRGHLTNMLNNLVDNAVKYSVGTAVVSLKATATPAGVCVEVSDKGIGIPQSRQKYIFDKFYRVPNGDLHNVKGYGLGLFYVKSLMDKMGGRVEVESKPGVGSTFKLFFYGKDKGSIG